VKTGMMSEKEKEARAKILELEAQLIAAGQFVGINENAIGKDELAGLAAMQSGVEKDVDVLLSISMDEFLA
jgi:hypothetical protein